MADAGVGFEGELAEEFKNRTATPAAEFVPEHVAEQSCGDGDGERRGERVVAIADGGAHDEDQGVGGKGNAGLDREDPPEQEGVAVEQDQGAERRHSLQLAM